VANARGYHRLQIVCALIAAPLLLFGCGDPPELDRGLGKAPLKAGETSDITGASFFNAEGIWTPLIGGGLKFTFELKNGSELNELKFANLDCLLFLKDGRPADKKTYRIRLDPPIPPGQHRRFRWDLQKLEYHFGEYAKYSHGIECELTSGLMNEPPPPHPFLSVISHRCKVPFLLGKTEARIKVRNASDKTVEALSVKCWSPQTGEWQRISVVRRSGAPLSELLPPQSEEWLIMEPPCIEATFRDRPSEQNGCRIDSAKTLSTSQ
jgi:hypothetical protein